MKLSEKIITLRKKHGWSQEELAYKLDVSRQSVSKWESEQSTPELQKIVSMSELFGVSTDYLLKEEDECAELSANAENVTPQKTVRHLSKNEAKDYLETRKRASREISTATLLLILSPIALLILSAFSDAKMWDTFAQSVAVAVGLGVMIFAVAIAVVIYVRCGIRNTPYEFLEKEEFTKEQGVDEMVREAKRDFSATYLRMNVTAVFTVIVSVLPLIAVGLVSQSDFKAVLGLCSTLILVGCAVWLFICSGVVRQSHDRVLREGDYSPVSKKIKKNTALATAYWLTVTAIFLLISSICENWRMAVFIWPVAAVFYGAFIAAIEIFKKDDK